MKKLLRKGIALLLSLTILSGCLMTASAAFTDFTDVKNHWAKSTLEKAYTDGILKGYNSTTMAPNKSMTAAQAVTVLCRVLHVSGQGDTSKLEIPEGAWYAQDAAKAVYIGLLDERAAGKLDDPISRGEAFLLFGRAFQITKADPDLSVLARFPDTDYLTGEMQRAAASLVMDGIVDGSDGKLKTDRALTRAEFVTILYRLADRYMTAETYIDQDGAGTVLSGNANLVGFQAGSLWFDQTSSRIDLIDTSATTVGIRSDLLESFSVEGTGSIGRLILAAKSGDTKLTLPETYTVGTLAIGSGTGEVTFSGAASAVEVTGSNRTISIDSDLDTLAVSGNGNQITLKRGCKIGRIVIHGVNNVLKLDATADQLMLAGRDNVVNGSGRVGEVVLNTKYYRINVPRDTVTRWSGYNLDGVEIGLTAPDHLAAGASLQAAANITVPEESAGKLCTASWYINDVLISEAPFILGKETPVSDITPEYTHALKQDAVVKLVVSYVNSDGDTFQKEAAAPVWLDTFEDLGLADATLTLSLPETLAPGETLQVSAAVDTPEKGQVCTGKWYVDGKEVASGPYTLGKGPAHLSHQYSYYYGMPKSSEIMLRLTYTTKDGRKQELSAKKSVRLENYADNGIARASVSLQAPSVLEAGKTLAVTANLKYLEPGKTCTGTWYVDGKQVSQQTIVLGKDVPKLSHKYKYTENMKLTSKIQFVLTYTTADGRDQKISASQQIQLKNYGYSYYHKLDPDQVLKMVTSRYAGNYTLAWAKSHDYSQEVKTAWVNLKGYKSRSQYLVWVNLTYQRVNIFQGSQGHWKLIRECLCGAGKNSTPTIRGVFTTSYKQSAWNYGSYYCGPIVRFNGTSGYAFHSRLQYWPMNSDRYYDGRIGFPISHGCLRMYNNDIWFMYNNIPNGTTVVVH